MVQLVFWLAYCVCFYPTLEVVAANETIGSRNDTAIKTLVDRLLNTSHPSIRPNANGPPVEVMCDFYVEDFGPLETTNMLFTLNIFFRQRWKDPRLAFADQEQAVVIPWQYTSRLWIPDVFFPNEKAGAIHSVTVPNRVANIFPDGTVWYSSRLSLKLACALDLHKFPHDSQDCAIRISSYTYSSEDVQLRWLNDKAVEIYTDKLQLPEFEIIHVRQDSCREELTTGDFSCIMASFHLHRLVGYFVLQTYLPSILIVILSWVSFWVSKDAIPARITLGVTTVLTMTTQLGAARTHTMRVSYPKAMDVWYAMCMVFVFGALLEYALVHVLWSRKPVKPKSVVKRDPNKNTDKMEMGEVEECRQDASPDDDPKYKVTWKKGRVPFTRHTFTAASVDSVSRYLFPGLFLLFNLFYWPLTSTHFDNHEAV